MRSIKQLVVVLATLFAILPNPAGAAPASGMPPGTMSVKDVRAGMTGYGLTVFEGTKPERFNVRVVSVVPNFLPGMDVILIYCDDPRVKYAGVTAGMSGSPIYLEGKLVGALAYGWQFHKDPIAGVTPIEYMIAAARLPLRGPERAPLAARGSAESQHMLAKLERSNDDSAAAAEPAWWRRFPMPSVPRDMIGNEVAQQPLRRVGVPLALSGFEPRFADEMARVFAPYGLEVLAGAGGVGPLGADNGPPARFGPGDAIGVELVRGDMSAAGTGTVTWVEGNLVAAFGHPMMGAGETYLPVSTAKIHTFINSSARSFKLSSPLRSAGSLIQDRPSCIVADVTRKADMIPVSVHVRSGKGDKTFNTEVARHRFLTPILVGMSVGSALGSLAPDVTDVVAEIRSTIQVAGFAPIQLVDNVYSPEGLGQRAMGAIGALRVMSQVLFNPFDKVKIERIDISADLDYRADFAQVVGLRLTSDELEPGSRVNLQVVMQPYGKPEYVENIPIDVPRKLAGQALRIEVAAGQHIRPDIAPPVNLRGYIDSLRRSYSSRTLVVTLQTPDEGAMIRGKVLPDLPSSEIDTLRPDSSTTRSTSFRPGTRFVHEARRVVTGQTAIQVRVKDEVL